jgi:hypothetical protein
MPVAVIAVSMFIMLVVATPSRASPSCMSKTEARQHFGSKHVYWHGQNHCWDANPTRRLTQNHKGQRNRRIHEVQRNIDQPKWQESMSEMLSDDEPVQTAPQTPWIAQTRPPSIIARKPEPMVSPHVVLLAFVIIAIGLTLAAIEFLFRRTVQTAG